MFAFDKVISSCCIRNLSTYLKGTPTVLLLQRDLVFNGCINWFLFDSLAHEFWMNNDDIEEDFQDLEAQDFHIDVHGHLIMMILTKNFKTWKDKISI
ncbi:hypothetical protein MTR_3g448460 [Medicago truncatula]|uniref:Uncharacterized protein n=1 Tax=Medicago truncatula TaxID=3880 RepID=A0A072UVZ2_MEDTR|nr:hypothetical protein MTR_3g448460 [Medicago truncatula]